MSRQPNRRSAPIDRRKFLVTSAAAGGGLLFGCRLPTGASAADGSSIDSSVSDIPFNAWIRISTDDTITILVSQSEMGQGVYTSFPMLVADELGADWSKIKVEAAPADRAYVNALNERAFLGVPITEQPDGMLDTVWDWVAGGIATRLSRQFTGGSTSIRFFAATLREAGAAVRHMLVNAAAQSWGVPISECVVDQGLVLHPRTDRALSFGELANAAVKIDPPLNPVIKSRDDQVLIGRPVPRLDTPAKVNGSAQYGLDVRLPDMVYGVPVTCPVFGGTVKSYDSNAISSLPGYVGIAEVPNGVVVVADSTWRAQKAAAALPVEFDPGDSVGASSSKIMEEFRALEANESGVVDRDEGDVEKGFAESARIVDAEYSVPYLAHACLEPINCTVRLDADQ